MELKKSGGKKREWSGYFCQLIKWEKIERERTRKRNRNDTGADGGARAEVSRRLMHLCFRSLGQFSRNCWAPDIERKGSRNGWRKSRRRERRERAMKRNYLLLLLYHCRHHHHHPTHLDMQGRARSEKDWAGNNGGGAKTVPVRHRGGDGLNVNN